MIQFIRYNFLQDGNALDPYPTHVGTVTTAQIQNAQFNDFLITTDNTSPYSTEVPTDWDLYTMLWATFDGNLNGGSVDYTTAEVDSIRIKRRKVGEFDWVTIYEQPINSVSDFYFSGEDYFAVYGDEYEYAWVPVLAGIEGNYVTQTIESQFNAVYICDADTIYKFVAGVSYGPTQKFQQVGLYNPIGQQYPIYVTNGANNYETGSFTGKIIGNYEETHEFNRKEMVEEKKALFQWLTNKKAKILKDYNGNMSLIFITGAPSVSYDNQWGNGMMEISFQWGELGNPENAQDMQNNGLWPTTTN